MPVADVEYDGVVHVIADNHYLRDYHRSAEQQQQHQQHQQQAVGVVAGNAAPSAAAVPEVHQALHPMAPLALHQRQVQQQPNGGDPLFVSVSSRKYRKLQDVWRSRTVLEKWIIFFVAVLFSVGLVLAVLKIRGGVKKTTCFSEECLVSADNILRSINVDVEPCDDFYEFACGKWQYHHRREFGKPNNWFVEKSQVISTAIREILEEPDRENDLNVIKQARRLYRACLDTSRLHYLRYDPVFKFLDKVGLPRKFPDLTTTTYYNGTGFNVARSLALIQRYLGLDLMVQLSLSVDPKTNRTVIVLGPVFTYGSPLPEPIFEYPYRSGIGRRQPNNVNAAVEESVETKFVMDKIEFMAKVIVNMFPDEFFNTTSLVKICLNIIMMELQLKKTLDIDNKPQEFTIRSLRDYMYSNTSDPFEEKLFNWESFIDHLTTESNLTWAMDDVVYVRNPEYFLELQSKLIDTPIEEIQQFLWWKIVETLIPHTTASMENLRSTFIEKVVPISKILTRPEFCTSVTNMFLKQPLAYEFYVRDDLKVTTAKIRTMIKQLQVAFNDMINESDWTDEATKKVTSLKANALKIGVGYPKIFETPDKLDEIYDYIKIDEHQYLQSMLDIKAYEVGYILGQVNQLIEFNGTEKTLDSDPLEVNAYYNRLENSINIPAGILQIPFFNKGVDVVNYGAIGSILGHEITHGFDIEGKDYDINGQKTSQWSLKTEREYLIRALCFVEQYDKFMLNSHKNLNGTHTLAENMADNVGLKQSWRAYKSHNIGEDSRLWGLTEYSNDQLFFLSYANVWCQKPDDKKNEQILQLHNDEHSPNAVRVIGSLRNSPEFAKTWKCPVGSPMNPPKKCSIW